MRVTERGLLLVGTAVFLVTSVLLVATAGEITEDVFGALPLLLWPPGFAVAGAIITRRRPNHSVGRLLMWAGFSAGAITLGLGLQAQVAVPVDELEGWTRIVDAVLGNIWVAPAICLFAAIARFPDGEWATPWVGRLFWVFAISFGAGVPLGWIDPDETSLAWDALNTISGLATVGIMVLLVAHLVRSIRSDPVRRRQYGWVVGGLVLAGAVWVGLAALLGSAIGLPDRYVEWLGPISFLIFPFTLVIAITRYKLYEIDRIFSRTITYLVVIGVLVAVYFGLVLVLRSFVPAQSPLAVALSTLAVAFAFFPLARRVQAFVDRRFFRSRYDAAEIVASFAADLRGTIDESAVVGRAEAVVDEVFAPEAVGVWLAGS
jgi:hypothetical protein